MTNFINEKIEFLRQDIMRVACKNNKGHIAPSLSCLDILTVLNYAVINPDDKLILSKGHGCYGLYAIWADKMVIPKEQWENFQLSGCLDGFGSLGHGLPIAVGLAYAQKGHVWCIVGDGELQEGSMWEALSFMYHHKLNNITVIVDHNGLQAMDFIDNVLSQDIYNRLAGWGFEPFFCDGHDCEDLLILKSKPKIVIAYTVKGKGVKCMENVAKFHYRVPNENDNKR